MDLKDIQELIKFVAKSGATEVDLEIDNNIAYLDFDLLTFPITIRKWKNGDSFIPFGMTNNTKVSDFLIDKKVTQTEKDQTWVMLNKNEIIWVIGHRISNSYKISQLTENCLQLRLP